MANSLSPFGLTHQSYKERLEEDLRFSWRERLAMKMWEEFNTDNNVIVSLPVVVMLAHECTDRCGSQKQVHTVGANGTCDYRMPDDEAVKNIAAALQWLLGTNVGRSFMQRVNKAVDRIEKADNLEEAYKNELSSLG